MMFHIGENIRKIRIERGMTQEELASKIGYTSKQAITKIESGDNNIPLSKVETFADALNTSPVDLLFSNDIVGITEKRSILIELCSRIEETKIDTVIRIIKAVCDDK